MKTDVCLPSSLDSPQQLITFTDQYVSLVFIPASFPSPIINSSLRFKVMINIKIIFSIAY